MNLRNKVTLIGRTGVEVETISLKSGNLAKVRLATTEYYINSEGEKVEETQWHNLVAFGKEAEVMKKYVNKGDEIAIEGKVNYRTYQNQEGVTKYFTEIKVNEILLLGSKK